MLGLPWHKDVKLEINYETGRFRVEGSDLPSSRDTSEFITIQNIGVKKFRSMLRKRSNNDSFEVYRVRQINNFIGKSDTNYSNKDEEVGILTKKFQNVF